MLTNCLVACLGRSAVSSSPRNMSFGAILNFLVMDGKFTVSFGSLLVELIVALDNLIIRSMPLVIQLIHGVLRRVIKVALVRLAYLLMRCSRLRSKMNTIRVIVACKESHVCCSRLLL